MEIRDVENLAELSRIELSFDEKKDLLKDMESILGYVKQIEKVEVGDVSPEYSLKNIWREDKTESREFFRELIINQFPDKQDNFLKVRKIL